VGEELRSPRGSLAGERNDATRGETCVRANERDGDDEFSSSLASASARLVALDAAVDAAAREAELSATGKDAAYGKKFARSLELFLEQARAGLRRARAAQAQAREAAETLSEKFGPAPPGANPGETLEAILAFVRAFETAAEETAAAKRARERERAKRPARE
jgi:isopropylmalate/homocitrate/citramalate synthase